LAEKRATPTKVRGRPDIYKRPRIGTGARLILRSVRSGQIRRMRF
jgi:hypothetical protein